MKLKEQEDKLKYLGYTLLVFLSVYGIKIALKPSDFTVFLTASEMLLAGDMPYNEWLFVSEGNYCFYFYSPLWAYVLAPFTFLPSFVAQYLWLLLNVFFLYRIGQLLLDYIGNYRRIKAVYLFVFILSARFLFYNFEMIQMTLFVVWGGLEALAQFRSGKNVRGAFILAFIINVKLLPLVLLPYLFYRGMLKAGLLTIGFSLLFLALPALWLGWSANWELHQEWFAVINPSNAEHLLETDLGPHSLTALIPTLFTETEGVIDAQRHIANLSVDTAVLIMNFCRLLLILFTLYFVGKPWFLMKERPSKLNDLRAIAYLFLLIPLIFPHQQKYAFFCIVPTVFYLVYYCFEHWANKSLRLKTILVFMGLSFLLMTLTTDGLVGRSLNAVFQHYKLITYGALMLVPALVLARFSVSED